MNRTKDYIKNTAILFVGKFVTQFMTFLLVPLYTHYLLTEDYGLIDIIQTYISLFIPIITLRFDSAIFRFLLDKRESKEAQNKIISNIFIMLSIFIVVFILLFSVLIQFIKINYSLLILMNIPALILSSILLQMLRGLGKNKEYSIACVITGVITLFLNCLLIIILKKNAGSILISSAIANYICSLYIILKSKLFFKIEIKKFEKKLLKDIMAYSIPMIPNSLSWWIVNVSDRTLISMFVGLSANGIYTVSCKFSNLINSVFTIFNMSWQETVSLHINDEDRDEFFSNMINRLLMLFMSISILIISVLPLVFGIVIGVDYIESYIYIPILIFANILNIFINLIGGIYVAKKETKKLAMTTMISAIINISINIVFIREFKLYAASISTLIAYSFTLIYRLNDIKKYVNFKLDLKKIGTGTILFILTSVSYLINNNIMNYFTFVISVLVLMIINQYELIIILKKLKVKLF